MRKPGGILPLRGYSRKNNSGRIALLILVIILALVVVNAFVILNFFPEVVFKLSPKGVYLMVENQAKNKLGKQLENFYKDEFVKDIIRTSQVSYTKQSRISAKLDLDNYNLDNAQILRDINQNILNTAEITMDDSRDQKNMLARSEISFMLKQSKLFSLEMFRDKDQKLGLRSPVLYDKYFVLNSNDLDPLYEKFDTPKALKKLFPEMDIYNILKIDKKELNEVLKDYTDFYINNITDSNITFAKGAQISTSEGDIRCNQITLKLDNAKLKQLYFNLGEKIANDDKAINLTIGKYYDLMKLYVDSELLPDYYKDRNALKQEIKKDIEKLKNDPDFLNSGEELIMDMYIDKNFNILERKIRLTKTGTDSQKADVFSMKLASYKMPKSKYINRVIELSQTSDSNPLPWKWEELLSVNIASKGKVEEIIFNNVKKMNGDVIYKIDSKLGLNRMKSKTLEVVFNLNAGLSEQSNMYMSLTGKLNMTRDPVNKTMDCESNLYSMVRLGSEDGKNDEIGVAVKYRDSTKFDVPAKLPETNNTNALVVTDISQEEKERIITDIQSNLSTFIQQNAQTFNIPGINQ